MIYVLTLDGYVLGAFKNLRKAYQALESIEPVSILWKTDARPRNWTLWNLRFVFRQGCEYVSIVSDGEVMYELTKVVVV